VRKRHESPDRLLQVEAEETQVLGKPTSKVYASDFKALEDED
jgi:hypothetical protein